MRRAFLPIGSANPLRPSAVNPAIRTAFFANLGLSFVCAAHAQDEVEPASVPAPAASPTQDPARYGFATWHADYPVSLDLPSPSLAPVYQRSRRQALEHVAANLQGNTRREVWLMATDFFARAPEDAVEVLIGVMDRAFGQPMLVDAVRNAVDAMGRMERQEFDDALRRALEHPDGSVRQAALSALGSSGKPETVRATASQFMTGMDGRARISWLRAARLRLPDDCPKLFAQIMRAETPIAIRDLVLKEILLLPPPQGAVALEAIWEHAIGDFRVICAGVLHSAGRASGTIYLDQCLRGDDAMVAAEAVKQLRGRELGQLRDAVLRLSTHPRPEVRLAVAQTLAGVDGDDVTATYEVLSGTEELVETKSIALRELTLRGRPDAVTAVIEQAASATGSRLQLLLRMLGASGDPRMVDLFVKRFREAPPEEGRQFLIALALCRAPGSARALFDIYKGDARAVSSKDSLGNQLDTRSYVPVILPNLRGQEQELIAMWPELDRKDYQRRALYLQALSGIGVERSSPELAKQVADLLRAVVFDATEIPQLRIQALNALTRPWLDLEDVRRLTRLQESAGRGESDPMRTLVKDFLFEYF